MAVDIGKKRIFVCVVIFKLFIVGIKDDKCYIIKNVYICKSKESRLKIVVNAGFDKFNLKM